MGRKARDSEGAASEAIRVRVTPTERAALDRTATSRGTSAAEVIRSALALAGVLPRGAGDLDGGAAPELPPPVEVRVVRGTLGARCRGPWRGGEGPSQGEACQGRRGPGEALSPPADALGAPRMPVKLAGRARPVGPPGREHRPSPWMVLLAEHANTFRELVYEGKLDAARAALRMLVDALGTEPRRALAPGLAAAPPSPMLATLRRLGGDGRAVDLAEVILDALGRGVAVDATHAALLAARDAGQLELVDGPAGSVLLPSAGRGHAYVAARVVG
jgi:hypothetical protein